MSGELSGNIISLELLLFTDFSLGGVLPSFVFTSLKVSTIHITIFGFFLQIYNSILTLPIYFNDLQFSFDIDTLEPCLKFADINC